MLNRCITMPWVQGRGASIRSCCYLGWFELTIVFCSARPIPPLQDKDNLYLILEYADGGELFDRYVHVRLLL